MGRHKKYPDSENTIAAFYSAVSDSFIGKATLVIALMEVNDIDPKGFKVDTLRDVFSVLHNYDLAGSLLVDQVIEQTVHHAGFFDDPALIKTVERRVYDEQAGVVHGVLNVIPPHCQPHHRVDEGIVAFAMLLLLGHSIDQQVERLDEELHHIEALVLGFRENLCGNGAHLSDKA